MTRRTRWLALSLVLPAVLAAQQGGPRYAATAGDPLRYREITYSIGTLDTPNGIVTDEERHDSRLALRFGPEGTGEAWYEALALTVTGPQGNRTPATGALLGPAQRFRFTHDGRGHLSLTGLPDIPAAVDSVTDLRRQFDDFLLPLPEVPFMPGLEWDDSTRNTTASKPGQRYEMVQRRAFRVVKDTVTASGAGWLIVSSIESQLEVMTPGPQKGMEIVAQLKGSETGRFVFSRREAKLLAHQRNGEMAGTVTVTGIPVPIQLPQLRRYESTLELLGP